MQPLRKKWIKEHELEYLKTMKFMKNHYRIPIYDQIKEYVDQ